MCFWDMCLTVSVCVDWGSCMQVEPRLLKMISQIHVPIKYLNAFNLSRAITPPQEKDSNHT